MPDFDTTNLKAFSRRRKLFKASLAEVTLDGLYCEFGVAGGYTLGQLADLIAPKTIHGFDSLNGLPEAWNGNEVGAFAVVEPPVDLRFNAVMHIGNFEDIPVDFTEPIAFAHIDCDLYSSTKTIFNRFGHLFIPGTVIQFDEYYNYPTCEEDEARAFKEFDRPFTYIGYVPDGTQVAVKLI